MECYEGYKGSERPVRFWLGDREYQVVEVVDQWYSPDAAWFRVKADDGNLYILRCSGEDLWSMESFRHVSRGTESTPASE